MTKKKIPGSSDSKNFESLGENAYEWLVAAITSFRIPTNSQISENKLARELGVSRTPVREALKRLETEGLVKRGDAGRFTVAMLTAKDIDEAIDFLILCDIYMFQRASVNLGKSDAEALKKAARDMVLSAKKGDRDEWSKNDQIFHETIMRAADNVIVAEAARNARRRIQRFWARSISGAKILETCSDQHLDIAQQIIEKNMSGIKKSVEGHLSDVRANMHEIVEYMAPFFGASVR